MTSTSTISTTMTCDLDVLAVNFTLIDWEMHDLWLRGFTPIETVHLLKEQQKYLEDEVDGSDNYSDLLNSDVNDNYRLFLMLEASLLNSHHTSSAFNRFSQYQFLDEETEQRLVESYYSLDNDLCREIVGKKLNSRLRKDLDEVCEKSTCQVRLISARRQFDNVKRVFKTIEDMAGDYVNNIMAHFSLSRCLAQKYASLVFASSYRFDLSKKRLGYLTFDDIMSVCLVLIDGWMDSGGLYEDDDKRGAKESDDNVTDLCEPSVDKDFLISLRELKVALLERDKELRNVVCSRLLATMMGPISFDDDPSTDRRHLSGEKAYTDLETNFKSINRGIVSLAVSLSNNKGLKDFFVCLVEKVVEPFKSLHITKKDVEFFLQEYILSITESAITDSNPTILMDNEVKLIFARFMKSLKPAVLAVYPSDP